MDYADPHGEVMPYVTPTHVLPAQQVAAPMAYPVHPVQRAVPMQTITLNGVVCAVTPAGIVPLGAQDTKKPLTKNLWVMIPTAIVATACVATLVIALVIALMAVVHAAIANALAIGVAMIAMVAVALMFILAIARMRHGPSNTSHTMHQR